METNHHRMVVPIRLLPLAQGNLHPRISQMVLQAATMGTIRMPILQMGTGVMAVVVVALIILAQRIKNRRRIPKSNLPHQNRPRMTASRVKIQMEVKVRVIHHSPTIFPTSSFRLLSYLHTLPVLVFLPSSLFTISPLYKKYLLVLLRVI
jgi:hypothetical protein